MNQRVAKALSDLSASERAEQAKAKMKRVVDHTVEVAALAENNAVVVYSPALRSQIPKSYAAHAFNLFQDAMHRHEIVRLCALWDRPDEHLAHESIPTVRALVDDPAVRDLLIEETRSAFGDVRPARLHPADGLSELDEAEFAQIIEASNIARGEAQATKARLGLDQAGELVDGLLGSALLLSVRNMRDKHFAHALETTRAESRGVVTPMKYGDESKLLAETVKAVEALYLWINGTSFDIGEARKIHRKYADDLWLNCRFDIPRGRSPTGT